MEISSGYLNYHTYVSSGVEVVQASVQKESRAIVQIPPREVEEASGDAPDSENVPLSSSVDIRSYLNGKNTSEEESGSDEDLTISDEDKLADYNELTSEEEEQVKNLKDRDQEVRQHEQAHLAASGSLAAGGAQLEYQMGPDGKQYAIGGHVSLDTSKEDTPEATIVKAKQVQRAALAPVEPSAQDIKVATQAAQLIVEAQSELAEQRSDELEAPQEESDNLSSSTLKIPYFQ